MHFFAQGGPSTWRPKGDFFQAQGGPMEAFVKPREAPVRHFCCPERPQGCPREAFSKPMEATGRPFLLPR